MGWGWRPEGENPGLLEKNPQPPISFLVKGGGRLKNRERGGGPKKRKQRAVRRGRGKLGSQPGKTENAERASSRRGSSDRGR